MTSNEIRTAYNKRDSLQELLHRQYGKDILLMDIDSMCDYGVGLKIFMEYDRSGSVAYCDFKNDFEEIYLWKLKPMISDATKLGIPAYISVIYRDPCIFYYILPLNEICKKLPTLDKGGRFMSEKNYVQFLHYIRKTNADASLLEGKSCVVPKGAALPNIKDLR